ncbi:MAG: CRISPR-associated endonuclease Cas3'' [Alkaliphilus sp.]|nr:MAG: CRISPR-associated endonuclease Cas3'' [Alkaliphilus sp.]
MVTIDLCKYFAKKKKSIREHTDDLLMNASILNAYGYINQREYELLIFACEYHDYGKVNPIFQRRIVGNSKFNKENEVVHNVLSLYFIDEKKIGNKEDYIKIAHAVLNHHDYGNVFEIIDERRELIEKLLSGFATYTLKSRTIKKIGKIVNDKEAIIVKGLLHKCDYSASAEIPIEFKNDFLNEGLRQLLNKWKKYDTSVEWNDLQKFCIANSENNIVAVAQTGLGKTEAGFHWIGNNKGFFILPIKTAINAIYKRVKEEILAEDSVNEKLALLHSDMLTYYNNTYTDNEFGADRLLEAQRSVETHRIVGRVANTEAGRQLVGQPSHLELPPANAVQAGVALRRLCDPRKTAAKYHCQLLLSIRG